MPEKSRDIPDGIPKDYRKVCEVARNQDFLFGRIGKKGHPVVWPSDPRRRPIPIPTTPGSQGLLAGWIQQLKRAGLQWPPP